MANTVHSLGEVRNYIATKHEWEVLNVDGAAQMLLWPLNDGVKKLDNVPSFQQLRTTSPESFKKAQAIFDRMRKHFWVIVKAEADEARARTELERKKVTMNTQENVRSLRDSIVYRGPLTTFLLKNFSGQMQGTETWSKLFFEAYAQGKTDISRDQMVIHLNAYQRENMNKIYQQAYEFLLGQDMANKLVRTYDYHKVKQIGACLAQLCSQGVEHIDAIHLTMPLSGSTTLESLGIQDDIVKFRGEWVVDKSSLIHLNTVYQDFIRTNKSAQIAFEGAKIKNNAQIARTAAEYGVSPKMVASNDRDFAPKRRAKGIPKGETMEQFEKRMADNQAKFRAQMRKKGLI